MRIAFWTAPALARPLHALRRWWQVQKRPAIPALNHLPTSTGTAQLFMENGMEIATTQDEIDESIFVKRVRPAPISYATSALAPVHFLSPCCPVATTALQKNHRASTRLTTTRRHATQRPLRMLHGSASPTEAGHFFLAGRVADVCAELERLADGEATH